MTDKTNQKIKIFISYGRTESEIFKKIVAYLESKGYEVWFDQTKIKGTDDWRENIIKGIRESQTVIAGLSEYFLRKGGVCSEEMGIALAIKSNRIFTIYLEKKEELGKIPSSLTRRQWVDLSDWEKYKENDKDLDKWLEKEIQPIIDKIESKDNKEFSGQINTIRHALRIPEIGSTKADAYLIKKYTSRDNLDEKVNEWLEDENGKKIAVVYGKPATGKSHYAAEKCHTDYHVAASFFCEYNKENFSTSKSLIRDLALQLACQIPDYRTALLHQLESIAVPKKKINQMGLEENVDDGQIHIREDYTEAEEFDYLIVRPLYICIDGDMENQMILIDALDEAGKVERNKLLDIIKNHLSRLPRWMKILILTRPEPDITSKLKDAHEIKLGTEENKKDIKAYLEGSFKKESYPNKKEIIETIIEKSQGTFLYAELVAKEILAKAMDIEKLDKLPTGLESYFLNWFSRIYPIEKIDEVYKEKDRKALAMILASPRPLPTEEIRNLLGWDYSQTSDFVKKIENYLSKKEDLEGKETIEIAHKYMADRLLSDLAADHKVYKEDGLAYIYKGIEELYMIDKTLESFTMYEKINLIDALKNQRGQKALKDFLENDEAKVKLLDIAREERDYFRAESATKLYEDMIGLYKDDEGNILYYSISANGYFKFLNEVGKEEKFIEMLKELIGKLENLLLRKDDMSYKVALAINYNNLGAVYDSMKRYEEAERYYRNVMDINEELKKSKNSLIDSSSMASTYNNLAVLYQSMQNYEESEIYYNKAIELYEDLVETSNSLTDISDLAQSYNNLGFLYSSMQRYGESEVYYKKALGLREDLKESRSSLTDISCLAMSYNCLGSLYKSIQNYEESEIYHRKAIELYKYLKKSRNSLTDISSLAMSYNNLGSLYQSMRRYDDSEMYYKKSIDLNKNLRESRNSLNDISDLARFYSNIGSLYYLMRRYDDSEIYHRKATSLYEELKGSRNSLTDISDLAMSYNNLGNLYYSMQIYDESGSYYQKAISLYEELKKSRNSITDISDLAGSYINLGFLSQSIQRYDDAEFYFKEAISLMDDIPNNNQSYEDKNMIVYSSSIISELYLKKNKLGQARKFMEKALKYQKLLSEESKESEEKRYLAIIYGNLGGLYSASKGKKAEKYFLEAKRIMEDLYDKAPDEEILEELIKAYKNLSLYYESRGKYKKAENYKKKSEDLLNPNSKVKGDFNILDVKNLKDLL